MEIVSRTGNNGNYKYLQQYVICKFITESLIKVNELVAYNGFAMKLLNYSIFLRYWNVNYL